jgi:copper(I)-binding protein
VSPTRRRMTALGVVLLASATAGCGAGQVPEVLKEHTAITGTNADASGDIYIRDAYATPEQPEADRVDAGQPFVLHFVLFNNGNAPDRLTSITDSAGTTAQLTAGPAGLFVRPGHYASVGTGVPGAPRATLTAQSPLFVGQDLSVTMSFAAADPVHLVIPLESASSVATQSAGGTAATTS